MKRKKIKFKKGSVLVFTLLILFILFMISAGIASVSITERKTTFSTDRSVSAFQSADSGVEVVLEKILQDDYRTLDALTSPVQGNMINCDDTSGIAIISGEIDTDPNRIYKLSFTDKDDNNITSCADSTNEVLKIKSVGTYFGVSRAVEVGINYPCQTDGLVGHWELDDGDGSASVNIAVDDSGNGNDGILDVNMDTTNAWVEGTTRDPDFALEFDGIDDVVTISDPGSYDLDIEESISVSTWLKVTEDIPQSGAIVSKGQNYHIRLDEWNGNQTDDFYDLYFRYGACSPGPCNTNWFGANAQILRHDAPGGTQWYHIVGTYDYVTSVHRLYVEGIEVATWDLLAVGKTFNSTANDDDLIFGSGFGDFPGIIDDVRVYNCELSPGEIDYLYNLKRPSP